jgi:hypothetical protein
VTGVVNFSMIEVVNFSVDEHSRASVVGPDDLRAINPKAESWSWNASLLSGHPKCRSRPYRGIHPLGVGRNTVDGARASSHFPAGRGLMWETQGVPFQHLVQIPPSLSLLALIRLSGP